MNREPLNPHVMIRQGITWYNFETEVETVEVKYTFHISEIWYVYFNLSVTSCLVSSGETPNRGGGYGSEDHVHAGYPYI